jgi:DNA-binding SARP family transcriptional activator
MAVEFGVLGPVQVVDDGVTRPIPAAKQRTALAVLLLRVNAVVPIDALIEALWPDRQPPAPRGALHTHLMRLRRTLGPAAGSRIRTVGAGYIIHVEDQELDSARFAGLTARGAAAMAADRWEDAADTLRTALALWRGAPLADVPLNGWQINEAARLAELRWLAVENWIVAELQLGRYAHVIAELRGLASAHPFRERFHEQLMRALYAVGRRAEALEVYRASQRVLAEELGVEPGPPLRQLQQAILADDRVQAGLPHGCDPVSPPPERLRPAQLPPDIGDFTGRHRELAEILEILRPAQETRPEARIVVLAGPGGVGKTALMIHASHQVSAAFGDGQIYVDAQGAGTYHVATREIAATVLRALGVAGSAIPDALPERVSLYRSVIAGRRLLIVLDNVESEAQIRDLLPAGGYAAVMIASRPRLTGLPGAHLIELGVLDHAEAGILLSRILRPGQLAAEPAALADLIEFSGGLPLALRIIGARQAAKPHWQLTTLARRLADTRHRLDELRYGDLDVRATISLSYAGLPGNAQAMLRRLSLLDGPDFPLWAGAAVLDVSLDDAEELCEQLVDAQLLGAAGSASGTRYRLHDLVSAYGREAAIATEPAAQREEAIARVLGGWLAMVEDARHELTGDDYIDVRGSAARWRPDSHAVYQVIARDPLGWLEAERVAIRAAVRQAAALSLSELCWELAYSSSILFENRGFFDDLRIAQEDALRATRQARNILGEAAILASVANRLINQRTYQEAAELCERALALFGNAGEGTGQALANGLLGSMYSTLGRLEAARDCYSRSLAGFEQSGKPVGVAHALQGLAQIYLWQDNEQAAQRCIEQGLDAVAASDSTRAEAMLLHALGRLHLEHGRFDGAARAYRRVLLLVRERGDLTGEAYALCGLGEALAGAGPGQADRAEHALQQAMQLTQQLGDELTEGRIHLALGKLESARGHAGTADHLSQSVDLFRRIAAPLWQARAQAAIDSLTQPAARQ